MLSSIYASCLAHRHDEHLKTTVNATISSSLFHDTSASLVGHAFVIPRTELPLLITHVRSPHVL